MADQKPKDKILLEPTPKDPEFFEWLESLFNGTSEYPEKIEARLVYGKRFEQLDALIKDYTFPPMLAGEIKEGAEGKEGKEKFRGKPGREELVNLSNQIIFRVQRDCDQARKQLTYCILAWNLSRNSEPYDRWLLHCTPKGTNKTRGEARFYENAENEDGEIPMQVKREGQQLDHYEKMFGLFGGGLEGIIDRLDRDKVRDREEIAALREENRQLREERERLAGAAHEREQSAKWMDLKIKSVEKVADMALGMAPPMINQLAGKKIVQTDETAESIALKMFFKKEKEGGRLTDAQADAAFGAYDDTPECNLVKPGVLRGEQAKLLWDVAHCKCPVDKIDELLPGGPQAVSEEQIRDLMQIFPMEQIAPLMSLIGMRHERRKQQQKQAE